MRAIRVFVIALLFLPSIACPGEPLELTKATIDTGGGESAGGDLVLRATIGQLDAGELRGGGMSVDGGFWAPDQIDFLFSDGFEEN